MVNPTKPRQTFIPIYNEEDANARYLLANTQTNFKDVNLMLVATMVMNILMNQEPEVEI